MAASTFRATGIPVWDQAGQGAGPVVGRYTLMAPRASGEAALEGSPFSTVAAPGGVVRVSDILQMMGNRVVPSAAHDGHALADTIRSPATASIGTS